MRICLGITGSIAAYRSPDLVKELVRRGHEVQTVVTRSAKELVSTRVLSTFSNRPALSDDVFDPQYVSTDHIATARWADCFVVYGATANFLGRYAAGLGDDFLLLQLLATRTRVILAPAMNPDMWAHPAVQTNVRTLRERGSTFVGPIQGTVACGETGVGHIAEIRDIVETVETTAVSGASPHAKFLAGQSVLLSVGPMRTPIDSVRYVQNRSSGRMGLELALAAEEAGAQVTVLLGPVEESMAQKFSPFRVHRYSGPEDYGAKLETLFQESQIFLSLAAVLDFELVPATGKIERSTLAQMSDLSLPLKTVPDFVARMAGLKKPGQRVIAFAAESGTEDEIVSRARKKLAAKKVDAIVANPVWPGLGPESELNRLWIISPGREQVVKMGPSPKADLSGPLLAQLFTQRGAST